MKLTLVAAVLAAAPGFADEIPEAVQTLLDETRQDCADLEGGALTVEDGAVSRAALSGPAQTDWVVDHKYLTCSSGQSTFCGTGGCSLSLIVGDSITERLSKGWKVVDFGTYRVVLVQIDGNNCGGINLTPCVEALVWDAESLGFSSVFALD